MFVLIWILCRMIFDREEIFLLLKVRGYHNRYGQVCGFIKDYGLENTFKDISVKWFYLDRIVRTFMYLKSSRCLICHSCVSLTS